MMVEDDGEYQVLNTVSGRPWVPDECTVATVRDCKAVEANALLIAAAPELANALEECAAFILGAFGEPHPLADRARAALRKAGRVP
jgi:hypothetical protein